MTATDIYANRVIKVTCFPIRFTLKSKESCNAQDILQCAERTLPVACSFDLFSRLPW